MKHVMVRWGTSGLMWLALAGCDGGNSNSPPAAPAVAASEPAATAPALVVSEAAAPASALAVDSTVIPTPAPAVVAKAAPTPPVVVVAATPTPAPAVIVAAAPPPPPAAVVNTVAPARAAADPDAAQALFKANDCTKCHAVDKVKKGPSLKKIAAELRGSADAQDKVIKNITTGPKIKLADGTEQEHKIIDSKDQKELKNLADWILSQ